MSLPISRYFHLNYCKYYNNKHFRFSIDKSKLETARAFAFNTLGVELSFTMEISNCGGKTKDARIRQYVSL